MSQAALSLSLACLSALTWLAAPAAAQTPEPVATVLDVSGPVTWRANEGQPFHPAHGGDKLYPGNEIATGARGIAHMVWKNGGDFKLLPESDLVIPADEGVRIKAGRIWAEFKYKLLTPFFFQAPSATAVVRGTVLGVQVLDQGATRVAVFEGKVEVSGQAGGAHVMLTPGQSINVNGLGLLGPVQPVSPLDRQGNGRGPTGYAQERRGGDHGDHDRGPEHGPGQGFPRPGFGTAGGPPQGGPPQGGMPPGGPQQGFVTQGGPPMVQGQPMGQPVFIQGQPMPQPGNVGPMRTMIDWLDHNRAAVKLEDERLQVRGGAKHAQPDAGPATRRGGQPPVPVNAQQHGGVPGVAQPAAFLALPGTRDDDDPRQRLAPWAVTPCFPEAPQTQRTGLPVCPPAQPQPGSAGTTTPAAPQPQPQPPSTSGRGGH